MVLLAIEFCSVACLSQIIKNQNPNKVLYAICNYSVLASMLKGASREPPIHIHSRGGGSSLNSIFCGRACCSGNFWTLFSLWSERIAAMCRMCALISDDAVRGHNEILSWHMKVPHLWGFVARSCWPTSSSDPECRWFTKATRRGSDALCPRACRRAPWQPKGLISLTMLNHVEPVSKAWPTSNRV